MKQVLQHVRTRELEIADVPEPALRAGGLLVRNAASLISAGTEKMVLDFGGRSLIGKARARPDLVRQTLNKVKRDGVAATLQTVMTRLDQPIPLGYSSAGIVAEVGAGVSEFAAGDRVACAGMGYASHAETVSVPRNLVVRLPDNVSFEDGAYVTLGAIALHGVRMTDVRMGELVAVIGLGILGQLTVQILRAAGCRVVGIDMDPARVALAVTSGAEAAWLREVDVAEHVRRLTDQHGADAVIITAASDSNDPIELAAEIARDRAVIAAVGAVGLNVPRKIFYEKELDLRIPRSYGPGRYDPQYEEQGHDYPIGYVRWTERRNMQEFLRLVSIGAARPQLLTSHRFPIAAAASAYDLIAGTRHEPFTGVILEYAQTTAPRQQTIHLAVPAPAPNAQVRIGCIGAGSFARAVLLPALKADPSCQLVGVCTINGAPAHSVAHKFGFGFATTDVDAILSDTSIDTVVIATRHDSHARLAARALRAGKHVFVEKPLAMNDAELAHVLSAAQEAGGVLAVGYNRRCAPLAVQLRDEFAGVPLAINYRINAGAIPLTSWVQDAAQGGGRIIGEVCHFVDLVHYLTDDITEQVFAQALPGETADTVVITLKLHHGSVAAISYFANGDASFAKERLEVFGGAALGVLEDFRRLTIVRGGHTRRYGGWKRDKGFAREVAALTNAIRTGQPPVALESLAATSRVTFAVLDSLQTGRPVTL